MLALVPAASVPRQQSADVPGRLEELKLLSKLENAGLLSQLEKRGLTLSTIESSGLLSKAEKFGLLSAAADRYDPIPSQAVVPDDCGLQIVEAWSSTLTHATQHLS